MRRLVYLCLFLSAAAHAQIVTIDAATIAAGTNITNSTAGITLRGYTNSGVASGATYQSAYTIANLNPGLLAGPNFIGRASYFNFSNSNDAHDCFTGVNCHHAAGDHDFHALVMTFSVPTNLLEVRVHFDNFWLDGMKLRLYNAQKQLLATCYATGSNDSVPRYIPAGLFSFPCGEIAQEYDCNSSGSWCKYEKVFRVTRSIPDIAYAIWGGETWDSGLGGVSDITFRRFAVCAL